MRIKVQWWWLVPVILLAFFLAARFLVWDAFWGDEVENLRNMGIAQYGPLSFGYMMEKIGLTRWPPAYNFAILPWANIFGWTEFGVRSLSMFFGVLAIAMGYRLGTLLDNRQTGFFAALLLGTSALFVFYMHEMRGYMLYILMTEICLYLYWYAIHHKTLSRLFQLAFILSIIVLIYTHYVALFVAATIGLYHLLFARKSYNWGRILQLLILAAVSYLPWIAIAILNAASEANDIRGLPPLVIIEQILHGFSNGLPMLVGLILAYTLVMVRTRVTFFLWFCTITILIASLGMNVVTQFLLHIRHLVSLMPVVLILTVIGLQHMMRYNRLIAPVILIIWLGVGLYANRDLNFADSMRGSLYNIPLQLVELSVETAANCATADDIVITHLHKEENIWDQLTIEYYFHGLPFVFTTLDYMLDLSEGIAKTERFGSYENNREHVMEGKEQAWVLISPQGHSSDRITENAQYLANQYAYCGQFYESELLKGYVYSDESEVACSDGELIIPLPACSSNLLDDALMTSP